MSSIPQYAKSADPAVIAAIEAAAQTRREFGLSAKAFAAKYGTGKNAGAFYGGSFGGEYSVSAIASDEPPTAGRWARRGDGWRPYKSNPAYKEMDALRVRIESVPGSPGVVIADGPDFRSYLLTPSYFVHDGTAYQRYSMPPEGEGERQMGEQWAAIPASEWHLAHEQYTTAPITADAMSAPVREGQK